MCSFRCQPNSNKLSSFSLHCLPMLLIGMKPTRFFLLTSPTPFFFTALQTQNPKNKSSYHRSNKDRNAENASYIHVQRDAVRTVSLNAPPCSRPTHGFYNKVNANKEPKLNLCPGGALHFLVCGLLSLGISWWLNESLLLPTPLFLFQTITTSWESQWKGFFHISECMWLKGCGKKYVGADDLALKLPSTVSQSTALCSPWIALFHSRGLFADAWHFLVALTALFKEHFRPTPCLFSRPSWLLSERVSLRVNCNIFDKLLSLPSCLDCF